MKQQSFSDSQIASLFFSVAPNLFQVYRNEMRNKFDASISIPQFRILAHLWQGPTNNKSLAEIQGVSTPAMSRMLQVLIDLGYIEREVQSHDRRYNSIKLTKKGKSYFSKIRKNAILNFQLRLKEFSQDEILKVGSSLQTIHQLFSQRGTL